GQNIRVRQLAHHSHGERPVPGLPRTFAGKEGYVGPQVVSGDGARHGGSLGPSIIEEGARFIPSYARLVGHLLPASRPKEADRQHQRFGNRMGVSGAHSSLKMHQPSLKREPFAYHSPFVSKAKIG